MYVSEREKKSPRDVPELVLVGWGPGRRSRQRALLRQAGLRDQTFKNVTAGGPSVTSLSRDNKKTLHSQCSLHQTADGGSQEDFITFRSFVRPLPAPLEDFTAKGRCQLFPLITREQYSWWSLPQVGLRRP